MILGKITDFGLESVKFLKLRYIEFFFYNGISDRIVNMQTTICLIMLTNISLSTKHWQQVVLIDFVLGFVT